MRATVIEQGGWGVADAVADWTCVFAEGLPRAVPPPGMGVSEPASPARDSVATWRERCRRNGRFQSLIFGLPQAGTDPGHPHRWRIRSMRMMLHGYEGIDLFLEQDAAGEWQVVETRDRTGVFS